MKKYFIFGFLISLIGIIPFILHLNSDYKITLIGDNPVKVECKDDYNDEGVIVKQFGFNTDNYTVTNKVDTNILGEQEVIYKAGNNSVKRIVQVVDSKNPEITLLGNEELEVEYNTVFEDPGFSALDNYDGNLTEKMVVTNNVDTKKLGEYEAIYEVTDSSKNTTKKVRKVKVVDTTAPQIKLNRKNNISIALNSRININDFKAIDNYDGDITSKVKVSGNVNTSKAGKYKVTYTVSDSSNNVTTLETNINVGNTSSSGIPVLMYHWFYDDTKGEKPGTTNSHNYIAKSEFEKQMKYLKDNNYYFPTWKELNDYIDGKIDLPKKSVILTDDDCLQSFFDVALPVFQKYEVPFTSFCITKKSNWQKYVGEKYLTFESHTNALHNRICKGSWNGAVMCKDYDTIYDDLKLSIEKVGNSDSFAYPFGHYNDNTIKAIKEAGIKLAFTIKNGRVKKGANKYKLPRVRISRGTSLSTFKKLVK